MTDILSDSYAEKLADEMIADDWLAESYQQLAHKVKELLARQRWVPVSEGLPEMGQDVLVYVPDFGVAVDQYSDAPSWANFGDEVTHWMPLPQPPEPPKEVTHWMPLPQPPEPPKEEL